MQHSDNWFSYTETMTEASTSDIGIQRNLITESTLTSTPLSSEASWEEMNESYSRYLPSDSPSSNSQSR